MFPGHKKGMGMISTSEYCAVGHPDRTCDFIASYLLDKYLEHDRTARVALEVQLKDNFCTVAGEVSANWRFTESEIAELVREAIRKVGYTDKYRAKWGHENAISGSDVEVTVHISQQSGDIAQGVNREGWGDQGIFFGMAVNDRAHGYMPLDYWLAREIANALVKSGWGGIDIKTQVTVEDGRAIECVVAIPLDPATEDEKKRLIADYVKATVGNDCEVIVNGTGRYVTHGPIGDCGTTGRKLVVDFYGGNSKIGGGSPWGKDPTKADVALNRLARKRALDWLLEQNLYEVRCAISCAIGRSQIRITMTDGNGNVLKSWTEDCPTSHVIDELRLAEPNYAETCREGLFGREA